MTTKEEKLKAQKRDHYLKNKDAYVRSAMKSNTKNFIKKHATFCECVEIKEILEQKITEFGCVENA